MLVPSVQAVSVPQPSSAPTRAAIEAASEWLASIIRCTTPVPAFAPNTSSGLSSLRIVSYTEP